MRKYYIVPKVSIHSESKFKKTTAGMDITL